MRTISRARSTPPSPPLAQTSQRTTLAPISCDLLVEELDLSLGVVGELVDGHDDRHAVELHVLDVLLQVLKTLVERVEVLLLEIGERDATVHLQRPDGRDQDHRVGNQAGVAALDVEELLGAQVGGEAGLGHAVVGQLEGQLGGLHRVAAVGDVGEGAAVDDGGRVLERLDEVRHEGVLEQDRHGAGHLEVGRGDRLPVLVEAHDDAARGGP